MTSNKKILFAVATAVAISTVGVFVATQISLRLNAHDSFNIWQSAGAETGRSNPETHTNVLNETSRKESEHQKSEKINNETVGSQQTGSLHKPHIGAETNGDEDVSVSEDDLPRHSAVAKDFLKRVQETREIRDDRQYLELKSYFDSNIQGVDGREFLFQVLQAYDGTDSNNGVLNAEHETLFDLLVSADHELVEQYALEQIRLGGARSATEWMAVVMERSPKSPDLGSAMVETLPNFTEPVDLTLGIIAVGSMAEYGSHESANFGAAIASYSVHEDENVRAATVSALSRLMHDNTNYLYVLENALIDTSELVRITAISSIVTGEIFSSALKSKLLSIVQHSDADSSEHREAIAALQRFSLAERDSQ